MYELALFLHIVGLMLLVGGVGAAMYAGRRMCDAPTAGEVAAAARSAAAMDHKVIMPGAVILLASGLWLVGQSASYQLGDTWIAAAIVAWVASAVIGHFQGAAGARVVRAADAEDGPPSDALRALTQAKVFPVLGGVQHLLLLLVFLYLMIWKPGA